MKNFNDINIEDIEIDTGSKTYQDEVRAFLLKKAKDEHFLKMCRGFFPMILTSIAFVFYLVLVYLFCVGKIPLPSTTSNQFVLGAGSVFSGTAIGMIIKKYMRAYTSVDNQKTTHINKPRIVD